MWLGIPFLYVKERLADTVTIDKIPSITVDSSFSWETIIAAFISGLVPALISLYVIKNNNESIRYQQKQEDKRHFSAHMRVVISEYAYQLSKVQEIHAECLRFSSMFSSVKTSELADKMSDALLELERYKASLLISIPEDDAGRKFKEEINEISESLSEQIKYGLKTTKMEKVWNDDYDAFISNSNRYLNK
ncbi:hypothetical protein [Klebsiella pneumoniae]|uniref:hypothetical protein n=2 Tax=Klebsiella pneumoniae TaxID=573 RepID=UPI002405DE17|nr:hypothetical protein [Klebsiella pneumoniae]MDG0445342.1 hypothetical protein [Klebsiella pneumoniae]